MDGLLIGRFQPFHLGHLDALYFALSRVDKLWIGLGSSNRPQDSNNPFSAQERKEMITSSTDPIKERIEIYPIPDLKNHIMWIELIDTIVPKFDTVFTNDELTRRLYSKRSHVLSIPLTKRHALSGTNIRDKIKNGQRWDDLVPEGTKHILHKINGLERLKIM